MLKHAHVGIQHYSTSYCFSKWKRNFAKTNSTKEDVGAECWHDTVAVCPIDERLRRQEQIRSLLIAQAVAIREICVIFMTFLRWMTF